MFRYSRCLLISAWTYEWSYIERTLILWSGHFFGLHGHQSQFIRSWVFHIILERFQMVENHQFSNINFSDIRGSTLYGIQNYFDGNKLLLTTTSNWTKFNGNLKISFRKLDIYGFYIAYIWQHLLLMIESFLIKLNYDRKKWWKLTFIKIGPFSLFKQFGVIKIIFALRRREKNCVGGQNFLS